MRPRCRRTKSQRDGFSAHPDHQQLARDVAQQMAEKLDHLRTADAARKESEGTKNKGFRRP
jgi:hypothetical protein